MPGKIRVVLATSEKQKHAERMRKSRNEWTEEQKARNRELSVLRMKAYRERKKEKQRHPDENNKIATRQEKKKEEERKERLAKYRREYRANLSGQKKRRIREKDALRKRLEREKNKKPGPEPTLPAVSNTSDVSQNKTMTVSALKKAVYRAKKRLPKSPQRFAEVVSGIVNNATPKKKQALKVKGLDSVEAKKDLTNILQSIKEVDEGMRGRDKVSRTKRKNFMASLSAHVKKRHGMTSAFTAAVGIHRKYFSSGCMKEPKKRKDCIAKETEESVQNFFYKDNISTNLPNKKNIKKDGKECRVLQDSLSTVWTKWKNDDPYNNKISFDKFAKLKPQEIKIQKHRKYLQCLCEYCENLRLKIQAINKIADRHNKPQLKMKNIHETLEQTLCPKTGSFHYLKCIDRECDKCGVDTLKNDLNSQLPEMEQEWRRWAMQPSLNKRTGKVIKKKELTTFKENTSVLVEEFITELLFLSKHLFEANWQITQFGYLTKNIPLNTVAMAIDFAENYSCTSQNEVQSAHWSKESVTIHPAIVYYRCPDCQDFVEECCDIVSEDLTHDAHAVNVFLHRIFAHLKDVRGLTINKAYIMSDGCASQYKSKVPFSDAANGITDFGCIIQRDYYGSRHGKNRCDGEGGVLKSRVTRAVKNGEAEIINASSFATFCENHLEKISHDAQGKCLHKRRHIFFVPLEDIKRPRPERDVKTVPGTQKIHSLVGVEREIIKTRRLSCFCPGCIQSRPEECEQKAYVGQWKPVRLKYLQQGAQPLDVQELAQPLDVQVQAQTLNMQEPAQPLDVQELVQPLNLQEPAKPLDMHEPAQPSSADVVERVDCSYGSDDSNMDISGLSGILDALEKEPEEISLSPILQILEDSTKESTMEKEPRLSIGHLCIILKNAQRDGSCRRYATQFCLKTLRAC